MSPVRGSRVALGSGVAPLYVPLVVGTRNVLGSGANSVQVPRRVLLGSDVECTYAPFLWGHELYRGPVSAKKNSRRLIPPCQLLLLSEPTQVTLVSDKREFWSCEKNSRLCAASCRWDAHAPILSLGARGGVGVVAGMGRLFISQTPESDCILC